MRVLKAQGQCPILLYWGFEEKSSFKLLSLQSWYCTELTYNQQDCSITVKFKGLENNSSQIKACFSHDGRYIISGSENHFVYIWDMEFDPETIHQSGNLTAFS